MSYSGGSATIVGPSGTPWTRNYGPAGFPNLDWWGGSWYSADEPFYPFEPQADYGNVTCSGEITVTMTWVKSGGDEDDTPPPYVLILKQADASWSGDSGNCANGLGHSALPSPPDGHQLSSGGVYELIQNPGDTIVRTISPSAYALVNNPPQGSELTATAGVKVRFTAYPIEIKLTGVLNPETDRRLMIGQNLGAYVSVAGLPLGQNPTYSWNVSGGNPFQSWNIGSDSATVTEFTTQTTPTLSTWLRSPTDPNDFTVTCTFYWPWYGATLNLVEDGMTKKPFATTAVAMVDPNLLRTINALQWDFVVDLQNPDHVRLFDPGPPKVPGITWNGWIDTPSPFDTSGQHGIWAIVQIVTPFRKYDGLVPYDNRFDPMWTVNGREGLDKSFPYESLEFPADNSLGNPNDNPAQPLNNDPGYRYVKALDSFDTFYIYKPPGANSKFVPLKSLEWYWKAYAHRDAGGTYWSWDAREKAWSYTADFPPHPTWVYRLDTTNLVFQ